MKINEFIEKYKGDNFESYLKENATVDYWNELVKTYKTDKLYLSDYDQFRTIFICRHIENDNGIGITFDKFCERQIKILEINAQYEPQQIETVKPDRVLKNEFKDFFKENVSIKVIERIQTDFKDCKGKKMAHLIYLLHKDFNIITYGINSRTESRKHFVSLLKGTDFRMAGIDKYFELSDVKLLNPKFESDPDYIDIKEKLLKTIK